jgi:hypothetical protein
MDGFGKPAAPVTFKRPVTLSGEPELSLID